LLQCLAAKIAEPVYFRIDSKTTDTTSSLAKEDPYIPVTDCRDIPSYLANGYSLRMSESAEGRTPSLIRPESIRGWNRTSKDLFFITR